MKPARHVLAAVLAAQLVGCPSVVEKQPFAQCEGHPSGVAPGDAAVAATVTTFVPPEATVRCSDSKEFSVRGSEFSFVYVAYGELQDCPAGCFASLVCAVYDNGGAQLYSASWNGPAEIPSNLPAECPETAGDTRSCDPPPPGQSSPLTSDLVFATFRGVEEAWRFCFF